MVAFEPQSRDTATPDAGNVQGWERMFCIGTGVAMLGSGVHRGGPAGWLRAALGSVVLARGLSGHCPVKRVIAERHSELEALRARIEEAAGKLAAWEKAQAKG
ncbi:DUF2892 family protein [Pseudomonas sp. SLBN-26]|uniref:DUF2892 domain-containing protein n=1 Tax=Metapseudomonas otitidis TaxID=319939 RepID=A0A679GPE4_9GAMM|nr:MULTISPECIES: DUF2892 domain-containing protein [Pseudomonas]KIV75457.1 hypothetical protein SZ55_0043 [Pseudomonas sp. FeS53a]MCO7552679.1 DUF2892 domain-containing protein [Pseudomonas otitidis]MCP1616133.1 hypothetical protein [Pseudomonas otitidis]MDH0335438.1 DUF2892 domain-containing protein [Pseudomonas otitidis]MDI6525688.1 DUF2892 domain-containing protein [Pseudomonas otitidis]